ncbi:YgaP family membrane protein [Opitutus terrae]|uniref:Inner membrane protein YgaP-like transmembrane domain-containing protein n=1 Tax=Opitutus terrae (strain DSM 11246 / JCM 15787 / PB90-1) TaxID=452637 RepID=B1ZZX5_OPITP|nr:DUF2892 domain-containing protein [Opitutus terrae]ACB77311.1 hypothetical protein Oter_4037 [Opitutus terrae PB90-1]
MKTNVGSFDAAVRFVAGCALLMLGHHYIGWWGLLGLIPIVNAATGFCLVYAALGISTTACDQEIRTARVQHPRMRVDARRHHH